MVKNINVLKPVELNEPILIGVKKAQGENCPGHHLWADRVLFFIDQKRNLLQKVTKSNVS
jgi:hypothetical protein